MKRVIPALVLLAALLSGCAVQALSLSSSSCRNYSIQDQLNATNLKKVFSEIAVELCTETCAECRQGAGDPAASPSCPDPESEKRVTMLVTDFVDINSFMPRQAGLVMGELMRGSLNDKCCYRIVQAEFTKYFKLTESGLVSLSRNAGELRTDEYRQSEAIVGTYQHLSGSKLLIFVKRINTGTSRISRMVTKEIDYTCYGSSIEGYSVK